MSIRFPKVHIAHSVVNRILNISDELDSRHRAKATATDRIPSVPEPSAQGARLDTALSTPLAPMGGMSGPGSPGNNAVEAVLSGGTPLNGLLDTVSGQ